MDPDPPQRAPRKLKFMPKIPPRPVPKTEVKAEKVEDVVDADRATNLMRQFQERSLKVKPKVEKKVQASQIAFGLGGASSTIKSYGVPRGGSTSNRNQGSAHNSGLREKEYSEPWDYYSYYPVTLPLRRPYSGDPAILDQEEFGDSSEANTCNESLTNNAVELGLMEENVEPSMFFLQLPPTMPMMKRSTAANSNTVKESVMPSEGAQTIRKAVRLNELPAGFMGKMLVYRSGAVKLKLGDTVYDVAPGMDCIFAQDVVAINTGEKQCCAVAEINKRAILTPEVDAITSSMSDL